MFLQITLKNFKWHHQFLLGVFIAKLLTIIQRLLWCLILVRECLSSASLSLTNMVFLAALNKVKDFVVWSWTYLWALWFLLVSHFNAFLLCSYLKQFICKYNLLIYTYISILFYNHILGCLCIVLSARAFKDFWKRSHGNNVSLYVCIIPCAVL